MLRIVFVLLLLVHLKCDENVAVLILARGGSKGIRLKNLQKVGGLTLLARAIHTAKEAGLNDVTVSTDDPRIALEALKYGAIVFHRSQITATDWAPSIWGVSEFLDSRKNISKIILIQATSPFIRSEYLLKALRKLEKPIPYDCIFSVIRSFKLRWRFEGAQIVPINFNSQKRPRRQDWDGEFIETGAFYIANSMLIKEGKLQNKNCTVWEVSSVESLEIDSYHDLEVANILLKHNLV